MLRDINTPTIVAAGLRIRGLRKRFAATPVLQDLDLTVAPGELISVLGPSGSGKTTLLRLVCGFERADAGRIELAGRCVADGSRLHVVPERRGIGYVAQEGALFPHLSVADNLLFGLPRKLRKARQQQRDARVAGLLELVGLPAAYARRKPSALSGGEQQRVALARALAPDPTVVLLDEPFSALDAGLRAGLRDTVVRSLKRVHATALLVTHDQDEALSIGERVAIMQGGRLAQVDTPQALYRRPRNADIARFVGEAALIPGTVHGNQVECCFGRLPLLTTRAPEPALADGAVEVMIRPEQFRVQAAVDTHPAPSQARVEQLTFYGHDARLALRLDCGQPFMAAVPGIDLPSVGARVGFTVIGAVVAYPRRR